MDNENIPQKPVFIIEGPAGAGKSTLRSFLEHNMNIPPLNLPIFPRPRAYEGDSNEALALSKDLMAINQAIVTPGPVIVDRWMVSSLVYNSIRRGIRITEESYSRHLHNYIELSVICGHQLGTLIDFPYRTEDLVLYWIFVMPGIETLKGRREHAFHERKRQYPYDASIEHYTYSHVIEMMKEALPGEDGTSPGIFIVGADTHYEEVAGWMTKHIATPAPL